MKNIYEVTDEFERHLCNYTGSKHVITLDNASNAIFLALYYEKNIAKRMNPLGNCSLYHLPSTTPNIRARESHDTVI